MTADWDRKREKVGRRRRPSRFGNLIRSLKLDGHAAEVPERATFIFCKCNAHASIDFILEEL